MAAGAGDSLHRTADTGTYESWAAHTGTAKTGTADTGQLTL